MLYFVYKHNKQLKMEQFTLMNIFTIRLHKSVPVHAEHDRRPAGNPKNEMAVNVLNMNHRQVVQVSCGYDEKFPSNIEYTFWH